MADEGTIKKQLRHWRDTGCSDGFGTELWQQFGELGLNGICIPESAGGLGLGAVEAGVVLEEIGRNLTPSPFLTTAVAAARALEGTAHGERWFPGILSGETVAALAIDEGKHHDPEATAMVAKRQGNGFVLVGRQAIRRPRRFAPTSSWSPRAPRVRPARPTASPCSRSSTARAAWRSRMSRWPTARRPRGSASTMSRSMPMRSSARSTAAGRPCRARSTPAAPGRRPSWSGSPPARRDMTVDYLKQRKQFGKLIGEFQALQHRAAHLYGEIEIARAAALKAAQLLDAGDPRAELMTSVAKAKAARTAALAVQEGVQMHGGIGMTDEHDIGLYMKREAVLSALFGDPRFHANRVAELSGY